ncbi:MAG: mRNA-degrading endonuclease RelE of RelBE toxin-antitoxin system [Acidimicrobiales bacterium]|jgi:mRNA-degrading endonuclease RelE of RelBE toxin-antitoxin system
MTWQVQTKKSAVKILKRINPADKQKLIIAMTELSGSPFKGNVKALKGGLKGLHRKRVGSYRILYTIDIEIRIVDIVDIKRRASKTYS